MRLFSTLIFFTFSITSWAQTSVFQGRVDFGSSLASFEKVAPSPGTLYLLTGAAGAIRIVSENPFVAEIDFVEGEWKDEANLISHGIVIRFEGATWAKKIVTKKPRQGAESLIYPYRKFQVAAQPEAGKFRVIAVPILF